MSESRKRLRQRAADVRQPARFRKRRRFAGRKQNMHRFTFIPSRTRRTLNRLASEKMSKNIVLAPRRAFDRRTVGRRTVDRRTVGRRTVGRRTFGRRTVGRRTVGRRTVGRRTVGRRTVGRRTVDRRTVDRRTVGRRTVDRRTLARSNRGRLVGRRSLRNRRDAPSRSPRRATRNLSRADRFSKIANLGKSGKPTQPPSRRFYSNLP